MVPPQNRAATAASSLTTSLMANGEIEEPISAAAANDQVVCDGASSSFFNSDQALQLAEARSQVEDTNCLTRLFGDIKCALNSLNGDATDEQIESIAIFIHDCMSRSSRNFHCIDHILRVANGGDAIQLLASFFHDIVYFNVDLRLTSRQSKILSDAVIVKADACIISTNVNADSEVAMVMSIFDLRPGDCLRPQEGCVNEFLSSVICVRLLQAALPRSILAEIVACIEATIPFRQKPMERLFERLTLTNNTFELNMDNDRLVRAVQRATDVSNRNCGTFTVPTPISVLDGTWKLLPELSPALRRKYLFSVREYHDAIQTMEQFFEGLGPDTIINSFRGVPVENEVTLFTQQTLVNLQLAKSYLRATMTCIALVSAFVELTGGDAPICFFLGDLSRTQNGRSFQYDWPVPSTLAGDCNTDLYQLLLVGRNTQACCDAQESALAAFLYGSLGEAAMHEIRELTQAPMTRDRASRLLSVLPREIVFLVGSSIAQIATARSNSIEDLLPKMF